MTPEEKANRLVEHFIQSTRNRYDRKSMSMVRAIQCAEICVEEIINQHDEFGHFGLKANKEWYWNQVKQELIKLKTK